MKIQVDSNNKPYVTNGKAMIANEGISPSTTRHMYIGSYTTIATGDLFVDDVGSSGTIEISSASDLAASAVSANEGNVYLYTGDSTELYTTNDIYIVELKSGSSTYGLRHYTRGLIDEYWSHDESLLQNGTTTYRQRRHVRSYNNHKCTTRSRVAIYHIFRKRHI